MVTKVKGLDETNAALRSRTQAVEADLSAARGEISLLKRDREGVQASSSAASSSHALSSGSESDPLAVPAGAVPSSAGRLLLPDIAARILSVTP